MFLRRISFLCLVATLGPLEFLAAQDMATASADPLAVADSLVARPALRPGYVLLQLPGDALQSTVKVYLDRETANAVAIVGRSMLRRQVTVAGRTGQVFHVRYRLNPASRELEFAASAIARPADPDSISAFVPVPPSAASRRRDTSPELRLNRSGSITRGVIAGNRRDATIESGLRLQLAGEILEGVSLRAVLSDENTPIVPEGTTQRIEEFDQVAIEIESSRGKAQLGDFEMALGRDSYAQISRKLQGAQVRATWDSIPGAFVGRGSATVSGAAARGIFRSQSIQALEGVQGPYRLEGNGGERFIILIPGSEIVYVDGIRLQRGAENDYVVDYATAEITFTSKRVMSADRRIVVEFQYTTNQFTRTLLATEVESGFWNRADGSSRASVAFSLLREADGSQFVDEFGLSALDSLLLAGAGDNRAVRSGATIVEYDPEAPYVHYVRETRTNGAVPDTVFVALTTAPADSQVVYRVQFSRVAPGTGAYVRAGRSINGILYEYVGPGGGEYDPVRILPQPRRQQLFDIRGTLSPVRGMVVSAEWARSELDANRLSTIDSEDDVGDAVRVGVAFTSPHFRVPGLQKTRITVQADRSLRQANFTTFDRVREVEFARQWNLPFEVSAAGAVVGRREEISLASVSANSTVGTLMVEGGRLEFGPEFIADRAVMDMTSSDSLAASIRYRGELISSSSRDVQVDGRWERHKGRLGYAVRSIGIVPYVEIEFEDLAERGIAEDSLLARSLRFTEVRPGLSFTRARFSGALEAELRSEERPLLGVFDDALEARTLTGSVRYNGPGPLRAAGNFGVRRTDVAATDISIPGVDAGRSVVLGLSGEFRPLKRAASLSWLYEAQTERTPRLQEIYIRIGPEQGEYVWVDSNDDGVIQLEEFVQETTPNEGTYARTYVPSDSLFGIVGVRARARLDLQPRRLIRSPATALAKALAGITSATTIEVTEKNRSTETFDLYALRQSRFRKPGLTLNGRLLLRQTLGYARPGSRLEADVSASRVQSIADLAAGLEERLLSALEGALRYRVSTVVRLRGRLRGEQNRVESESFSSRVFDLRTRSLSVGVDLSPSQRVSIGGGGDLSRVNDRFSERSAVLVKLPIEMRYQSAGKYQLSGRFELANVSLTGSATGLAEFELTDGRGAGTSTLWSLVGQWALNNNLRASLAYDGRAPAAAPVIHTMRMQLSAIF